MYSKINPTCIDEGGEPENATTLALALCQGLVKDSPRCSLPETLSAAHCWLARQKRFLSTFASLEVQLFTPAPTREVHESIAFCNEIAN
jgi:hypothetical protein